MPFEIKPQDTFLYKMGQERGEKLGEKRGKKLGEKRGEKNKQDVMILALLKKGKLFLGDIAEAAGVSVAYVNRLKKKAGILESGLIQNNFSIPNYYPFAFCSLRYRGVIIQAAPKHGS